MKLAGFVFEHSDGKVNKITENLTSEEYETMWTMLTAPIPPEISGIQGYLILKEDDEEK